MRPPTLPFVVAGTAGAATLTAASAPSPLYPVYARLWGLSAFTLTVVFAVYVLALLLSLLTVGSLSDRIGRRPVVSAALVVLALGMLLFAIAGGTGGLVVARIVQGIAVGAATSATTAMITDAAPSPRLAAIVSSAVPTLGIAIGAVLSGALVEFAPHPRQLIFWVLGAAYLLFAALVWTTPEPSGRPAPPSRASLWHTLAPSIGLPASVRPTFAALVPSIVATWALGGLYLSLGSSVLAEVFAVRSHLVVGVVLGVFFVAGTSGTVVSTRLPPSAAAWFGLGLLAGGVLVTVAATLASSAPLYLIGSAVAGIGFGATFRSAVDALGAAAPTAERGQVFATMYIVSYLAFSLPALAAGLAVARVGLEPTAVAYGSLDVALAVTAMVAEGVRARQRSRSRPRVTTASAPTAAPSGPGRPRGCRR